MKKKAIACDILIAINSLLYYFIGVWIFVTIGLSTTVSQSDNAELIAESTKQGYACFSIYMVLMGLSLLYLVYRFIINFFIDSSKIEEEKRRRIQKTTFALSIFNSVDLIFMLILPVVLSNAFSTLNLLDGSYFLRHILPWLFPIVFSAYYVYDSIDLLNSRLETTKDNSPKVC